MATFNIFCFFTACASVPHAGRTTLNDLRELGLADVAAPVEVRAFRASCPWCLEDLHALALERPGDHVPVVLLGFRRAGTDTPESFTAFVQNDLPRFDLPAGAVRAFFVDEDLDQLKARRNAAGDALFPGLRGVPYHLVVDRSE